MSPQDARMLRDETTQENEVILGQSVARLKAAIMAIPPAFREVILLKDLEGMSYRAIADILEVPVGTVMSRISRGRDLLRRRLAGAPA